MTPSTLRAQTTDAARAIIREKWPLGWSSDRIASRCEVSAPTVRKIAREEQLPERRAGGKRTRRVAA